MFTSSRESQTNEEAIMSGECLQSKQPLEQMKISVF